jgi:hypothetical protein
LHVSGSTGGVFEVDTAGGSTTFYVSASGNVGIGTTNPSYRLTIQNNAASTNALLALQNLTASATTNHGVGILPILSDNTGSTDITAGGLYWLKEQQWTNDTTSRDSYLRIDTTENGLASEKVRITSAGNVGIGTTSPRSGLQVNTVNGAAANEYAGLIVSSNLSSSRGVNIAYDATNDAGIITAVHAGTGWKPLALQPVNGNVGIGTTNPTARLHVSSSTGGVFEVDTAGGATTFYVSASGNVGIGTITPNGKLHIVSPDSTYAFSVAGATKGVRFNINSAGTYIQGVDNTLAGSYQSLILGGSDLYFQTNGLTTAMYISSSGNVGIGTSSPTNKLHVVGEIASYKNGSDAIQSQLYLANTGNTQAYNFQLNSAGTSLDLWGYDNANGWKNNVTFGKSGNVGIGTSTSILGKLQLNSDVAPYYGPVTSSATPNGIFVLGSLSGDVVNTFGVDASATAYAWIQPRKTTVASYSNLVLNPNGGNVGIGTTLPASKFHISGSGQTIMRLDSDTTTNVSQFQIKAASDAVLIMGMLGGSAASTNFGVTAAGQAYFGTTTLGSPHPTSLVIGNASNIPIIFSTNNIERMRIDSVGNVGIGTTSANNKLEVIGGTNTRINLGNIDDANRGGKLEIISGSVTARQFYVGTNSAIYNLVFGIDSVEKMRIDTNGNVGIGVTAPLGRLHITGSSTASETLLYLSKGSGSITQNYINAVDQSGASNYRVTSDINGYAQQVLFRSGTSYVNHDAYWSSWINNANYTQGGLALGTGSLTHGYALNISRPATSGSLYVSGSSIFTGSVSVSGSVTFSGPIIYDNAVLLDYGSTSTPVVSTNYAVLQNLTGSYNSAFFDYFASSGSNFRAGTVIAGWSGSSVNYTEYSTTDVGNTNQLSMSVDLSGSFVRLLTRVSTTINWNIKSAGRYL